MCDGSNFFFYSCWYFVVDHLIQLPLPNTKVIRGRIWGRYSLVYHQNQEIITIFSGIHYNVETAKQCMYWLAIAKELAK